MHKIMVIKLHKFLTKSYNELFSGHKSLDRGREHKYFKFVNNIFSTFIFKDLLHI